MRFLMLMIPKGYETAEPGTVPSAEMVAEMAKYNESLTKDRDGVQEVQLLAPALLRDHETGLFQHAQMLHHPEARHRQPPFERAQRLAVVLEQCVEELAPRRSGEGSEDRFHGPTIGDFSVTCQAARRLARQSSDA